MKFKAVIFDLDGTLVDSLEDIADALNAVLRSEGLPLHPLEKIREWVGEGARKLVQLALPAYRHDDDFIDKFLLGYQAEYRLNCTRKTRIYEEVPALLDQLAMHRLPMNILSNKPQEFTSLLYEHYFSPWKFKQVVGQRQGIPKKPDPAAALEIADKLGLSPSSVLYIGDSETDIQTAKNAGMQAAAVCWGFRSQSELASHEPAYLVNRPDEIVSILFENQ
jgi:phosphoglycolate phosphatase